jgi:hypothetical protein
LKTGTREPAVYQFGTDATLYQPKILLVLSI